MRRALLALLFVGGGAGDAAAGPCDGVATHVARSVWRGIEDEVFAEVLAVNTHITVMSSDGGPIDLPAPATVAMIDPDVIAVEPFAFGEALALHGGREQKLTIKGVDPATFAKVLGVSAHVVRGDARVGGSRIWLGADGARTLGVAIGDEIDVTLSSGGSSRRFRVAALHHYPALPDAYDSELAIVSIDDVRGWMKPGVEAFGVELALRDPARAKDVAGALAARLGARFVAIGWHELNKPLFEAMDARRAVLVTGLSSALVVGASIWCRR